MNKTTAKRRQVVLDVETTGLDYNFDRIIEVGCAELNGGKKTGNTFNTLINPYKDGIGDVYDCRENAYSITDAQLSDDDDELDYGEKGVGAEDIHGISIDELKRKPSFDVIANDLLYFIKGADIIAHNAIFDVRFLNMEFHRAGFGTGVIHDNCKVIDTLALERKRHPRHKASMRVLMRRYLGLTRDAHHRALSDANTLADIYLAMMENKEVTLDSCDLLPKEKPGYVAPIGNTKPHIPASDTDMQDIKNVFAGKKVVITGAFKRPRAQIKTLLEEAGAKVVGAVSGATDILMVGDNPGSKLAKAEALDITIMDEDRIVCFSRQSA